MYIGIKFLDRHDVETKFWKWIMLTGFAWNRKCIQLRAKQTGCVVSVLSDRTCWQFLTSESYSCWSSYGYLTNQFVRRRWIICNFWKMTIDFFLTNSADPDEWYRGWVKRDKYAVVSLLIRHIKVMAQTIFDTDFWYFHLSFDWKNLYIF